MAALPPVKGVDKSIKSTVYVAQLAGLTGSSKVKFISVKEACASIYVPSLLTINLEELMTSKGIIHNIFNNNECAEKDRETKTNVTLYF